MPEETLRPISVLALLVSGSPCGFVPFQTLNYSVLWGTLPRKRFTSIACG